MAYNSNWNPDALPAYNRHAEPEQAAQILSQQQVNKPQEEPENNLQQQQRPPQQNRKYSNPPRSPRPYGSASPQAQHGLPSAQYNKPVPPVPSQSQSSYNNSSYSYNYNSSRPAGYTPPNPPPPPTANTANTLGRPSPPTQHGLSPPPRPPTTSQPPPGPRNAGDAQLFPLFKAVDKYGTGQLTDRELGKALVNGDFSSFDSHTIKMMIRMFDVDKNGSIDFDEFRWVETYVLTYKSNSALWGFLAAWRALFDRFDEDKSGYISFDEYTNALVSFGYRLSNNFVHMLYSTYDKGAEGKMTFDLFVQSCIILKRMTDVFKRYDEDRDGFITLSFEEFLTGESSENSGSKIRGGLLIWSRNLTTAMNYGLTPWIG
ncbi:uncharacterized protein KY384_008533 [Bacidia gigantensis]|uniref:uncharacterized protein n=1 Tax=Bacidia gigantensis TaxID=2732470 RepID=UPI001D040BF4|nr:uncharacterized protein KY384_008533 [Bacidia gigantensis]KAG8527104.1 hypothetical protein KY384_008533 [Bacidia gigantensis]